ncbi:UBN2_2 domain-containing protein, partial [Cephalotus follicularis]
WKEQISIILEVMELDYGLRVDAPPVLTAESSAEQKVAYDKWERSNRISLMIMKGSITTIIRFQGSSNAHATALITKMVTLKYDRSSGVREHILPMNDMVAQLKSLDMEISEGFIVHFIMSSLLVQFGPFKINYNTQKEKWKMSELISMCVQEEERVKSEQPHVAHITTSGQTKGKGKGKKFGIGRMFGNKSNPAIMTDKVSSSGTKGLVGPKCNFSKARGHVRKDCLKFRKWLEKKGTLSICICYEPFTINAPSNTWCVTPVLYNNRYPTENGCDYHVTSLLSETPRDSLNHFNSRLNPCNQI